MRVAVASERAHRVLERVGPRVVVDADRLTVEHDGAHRQRSRPLDDAGQAAGHVVEVARVDPHDVVVDRGAPGCARRRASIRPTPDRPRPSRSPTSGAPTASIGRTPRPTSSPTACSPSAPSVSATTATRPRSPDSIAARRTSGAGTDAARGDGIAHEAGERALAQLADDEAPDESRLPPEWRGRTASLRISLTAARRTGAGRRQRSRRARGRRR